MAHRIFEQLRSLGQCCAQELIARQKQHCKFRAALELVPVGLGRKFAHARFHLLRMTCQRRRARLIALRLGGIQVGIQRRLGIDHQIAPFAHVHDQIRPLHARVTRHARLLGEITVRRHAGELHDAAQGQFTPATADLRAAQCPDQIACLALQSTLAERQLFNLRAQARERIAAFAFHASQLLFAFLQRLANRLDHLPERALAFTQRTVCAGLLAREGFARQSQKMIAVVAQGSVGELRKTGAQLRFHGGRGAVLPASQDPDAQQADQNAGGDTCQYQPEFIRAHACSWVRSSQGSKSCGVASQPATGQCCGSSAGLR